MNHKALDTLASQLGLTEKERRYAEIRHLHKTSAAAARAAGYALRSAKQTASKLDGTDRILQFSQAVRAQEAAAELTDEPKAQQLVAKALVATGNVTASMTPAMTSMTPGYGVRLAKQELRKTLRAVGARRVKTTTITDSTGAVRERRTEETQDGLRSAASLLEADHREREVQAQAGHTEALWARLFQLAGSPEALRQMWEAASVVEADGVRVLPPGEPEEPGGQG